MSYVKIGVGGPVGSGKTALIERLTRKMSEEYSICVVTNDIYTKEDAEFLIKNSKLPPERIVGVETGGCPHTAIREDCSMNLEAVEELAELLQAVRAPAVTPLMAAAAASFRKPEREIFSIVWYFLSSFPVCVLLLHRVSKSIIVCTV